MPKKTSKNKTCSNGIAIPEPSYSTNKNTMKGTNNPIHGNVFHLKLSMLFLIRGIKAGHRFRLGTEQEEMGGKFDDLVLMYKKRGEENYKYRFFQAKHRLDDNLKITLNDLLRDDGSHFSLPKYFRSYCENIVNGPQALRSEEIDDLVICTNIGVDSILEKHTIELNEHSTNTDDEIIGFELCSGQKLTKRFKFKPSDSLKGSLKGSVGPIFFLAKELVDCAKRGKEMNLRNDILKRYHITLIKEKVIDIKTKKFHQEFIKGSETGLSADALRLRNAMANMLAGKSKLWNRELKLSRNFGTSTGFGGFDILPDYVVTEQDVEEFLSKFVLAVDAPNEDELDGILQSEIRRYSKFDLLEQDFQNAYFFHKMLKWFKKKKENEKDSWMSSDEGKAVLERIDKKIEYIRLNGISLDYRKNILDVVKFNEQAILEMKQMLKNSLLNHKSDISVINITTSSPKLTANKVILALDTISAYQAEDSFLITSLRKLLEEKERYKSAFLAEDSHYLLVVVCDEINDELNPINYSSLFTKRNNRHEKTVLIIRRKYIKDDPSSVQEDPLLYDQLNDESKEKILSRKVSFQGVEIEVKDLIRNVEFHKGMLLDLDSIIELLDEENSIIIPSFDKDNFVNSFYIERKLRYHSHFDNKFWSKVAEKLKCTSEQLKSECQTDEKGRFKWLIRDYVRMSEIWEKIKKVLSSNEFKDSSYYETIEESDLILDETNPGKVVVISGVPGSGKSSILSQYYKIKKKQSPNHWVIRINLVNHYGAFLKFDHQCEIFDFLTRQFPAITASNSSFARWLLKQRLEHKGDITFLFDGFDEINNDLQSKTIELFKILRATKVDKLCITTRCHLNEMLANVFFQFAYRLENFNKEDQIKCLVHYWSKEETGGEQKKAYIRKFAETQIEQIAKNLQDEERSFVGVPLQCRILAECFERQPEGINNVSMERQHTIDTNLDLAGLYKLLMETKFTIYSQEKILTNQATKSIILNMVKERTKTYLRKLALELILKNKEDVDIFLGSPSPSFQSKEERTQKDLNDLEFGVSVGLLQKDFEGKIQFLHRTYAEYLVADFIYQGFEFDDNKHNGLLDVKSVRKLIIKNVFMWCDGVMTFLNCMMKTLVDNPKWQDAIKSHTIYSLPDRLRKIIDTVCIHMETSFGGGCYIAFKRKFVYIFRFICDCLEVGINDHRRIQKMFAQTYISVHDWMYNRNYLDKIMNRLFSVEYQHFSDAYERWLSFYGGAKYEHTALIANTLFFYFENNDLLSMGVSLWNAYWNNENRKRIIEMTLKFLLNEEPVFLRSAKSTRSKFPSPLSPDRLLYNCTIMLSFCVHNEYYDSILPLIFSYLSFLLPTDEDFRDFLTVFFTYSTTNHNWMPNRIDSVLSQLASVLQSDSIKRFIIRCIRREVLVMGKDHFLRLYKTSVAKVDNKLLSVAMEDARMIFTKDENQMTILHRAAFHGDSKAIEQLFATQNLQVLRAITIVLCQNEYSPFFVAATLCNEEICRKILLFLKQDFAVQTLRTRLRTTCDKLNYIFERFLIETIGFAFVKKRTEIIRFILALVRDILGFDDFGDLSTFLICEIIIPIDWVSFLKELIDATVDIGTAHNQLKENSAYSVMDTVFFFLDRLAIPAMELNAKTLQKLISVLGFEKWIRIILDIDLFQGFYVITRNLGKFTEKQHLQFLTIILSSAPNNQLTYKPMTCSYWEALFACPDNNNIFYQHIDELFVGILNSLGKEILKEKLLLHDDGKTLGRTILFLDRMNITTAFCHLPEELTVQFYRRLVKNLPEILTDERVLPNNFSQYSLRIANVISILAKYADKDQWGNIIPIVMIKIINDISWRDCIMFERLPIYELEELLLTLVDKMGPAIIEQLVFPYIAELLETRNHSIDTLLGLLVTKVPDYSQAKIAEHLLRCLSSETITSIFPLFLKYSSVRHFNEFLDTILSKCTSDGITLWDNYINRAMERSLSEETSSFLQSVKKYDTKYFEKLVFHNDGKVIAFVLLWGEDKLVKAFLNHLTPGNLKDVAQYGMQHISYQYELKKQKQFAHYNQVKTFFFSFFVDYGDKQQVTSFIKSTINSSMWIEWMNNSIREGKIDDVKQFSVFVTENLPKDEVINWIYSLTKRDEKLLTKLMLNYNKQLMFRPPYLSDKSYAELLHYSLNSLLQSMKEKLLTNDGLSNHFYGTHFLKNFIKHANSPQLLQLIEILLSVQVHQYFGHQCSLWSNYIYLADDNETEDGVDKLLERVYDTFGSQKVKELVLHSPSNEKTNSVVTRAALTGEHKLVKAMLKYLDKKDKEEVEHLIRHVYL